MLLKIDLWDWDEAVACLFCCETGFGEVPGEVDRGLWRDATDPKQLASPSGVGG